MKNLKAFPVSYLILPHTLTRIYIMGHTVKDVIVFKYMDQEKNKYCLVSSPDGIMNCGSVFPANPNFVYLKKN